MTMIEIEMMIAHHKESGVVVKYSDHKSIAPNSVAKTGMEDVDSDSKTVEQLTRNGKTGRGELCNSGH